MNNIGKNVETNVETYVKWTETVEGVLNASKDKRIMNINQIGLPDLKPQAETENIKIITQSVKSQFEGLKNARLSDTESSRLYKGTKKVVTKLNETINEYKKSTSILNRMFTAISILISDGTKAANDYIKTNKKNDENLKQAEEELNKLNKEVDQLDKRLVYELAELNKVNNKDLLADSDEDLVGDDLADSDAVLASDEFNEPVVDEPVVNEPVVDEPVIVDKSPEESATKKKKPLPELPKSTAAIREELLAVDKEDEEDESRRSALSEQQQLFFEDRDAYLDLEDDIDK